MGVGIGGLELVALRCVGGGGSKSKSKSKRSRSSVSGGSRGRAAVGAAVGAATAAATPAAITARPTCSLSASTWLRYTCVSPMTWTKSPASMSQT